MSVEIHAETAPASHVVQFYEDEEALVRNVGSYLAEGVRSDDVAVVVATKPHRESLDEVLTEAGVDVAAARTDGALVHADAGATLSRLMTGSAPDHDMFETVVGGLVREAAGGGRRVRIYGGLVAPLWSAGEVDAAIELERMWNRLRRQVPFDLRCAYPRWSSGDPDHAETYDGLRRLHSAVIQDEPFPDAEVARPWLPSPEAPRAARRFVADTLLRWGHADLVDDAALVVTELVTNAAVHARSDFVVVVQRRGSAIRLAVRDASPALPVLGTASWREASGRGLGLVDGIASRWGHHRVDGGKVVWADLPGAGDQSRPDGRP